MGEHFKAFNLQLKMTLLGKYLLPVLQELSSDTFAVLLSHRKVWTRQSK